MAKDKIVPPTSIADGIINFRNYHTEVVQLKMLISSYANMCSDMNAEQLKAVIAKINEKATNLDLYSSQ